MKELNFSSRDRTVKTSTPSVPKSVGILHHSKAYTRKAHEAADVSGRREPVIRIELNNPTVFLQNTKKTFKILLNQ